MPNPFEEAVNKYTKQQDFFGKSAFDRALDGVVNVLPESIVKGGANVISTLAPALDIIARPQYASARFFDSLADESKTLMDAISDSFSEFINPTQKLSFSDVIKRRNPEFAKQNPNATAILGFTLDIALDPLSYLGVGLAGKGIVVGSKVITKSGTGTLTSIRNAIPDREFITKIGGKLQAEVQLAAARGIDTAITELSPLRVGREAISLSKEYSEEMARLGINIDKKQARQFAMEELGLEKLPTKEVIPGKKFGITKTRNLVSSIVDELSLDIDRAMRGGRKLSAPPDIESGTRVSGGITIPRKMERGLLPVEKSSTSTTFKLGELETPGSRFIPETPDTAKGLATKRKKRPGELQRLPKGSERLSEVPELQGRFPMPEEVDNFAKQLIEKKVNSSKLQLKGFSDEEIQKLKEVISPVVGSYTSTLNNAIALGQSTRTVKNVFMENLDDVLKQRLNAVLRTPEGSVVPRGVVRNLSVEEIREKAEQRMIRIANANPELAKKWFKDSNKNVIVQIPFTKFRHELFDLTGITPLNKSVDFLKKFAETVVEKRIPLAAKHIEEKMKLPSVAKGLTKTTAAIVTAPKVFRGLFTRPQEQPFKDAITSVESQLDYVQGQVTRETRRMFDGMTQERRDKLTEVLREIDDKTRQIEFVDNRIVSQAEANDIFHTAMANTNLDAKEMSIVAGLKQEYANIASLEMESNLLKTEIANYFPRYYDSLEDAKDMIAITKVKYGLSTGLTSSQRRKYITSEEARQAGLIPEMDASLIYATRVISSRRALVKQQFFENLSHIFGIEIKNQNDLVKIANLPDGKKYLDDIKLLGESVYPTGMNASTKQFLQFVDWTTGVFKRAATIYKPSFAPKQAISNTVQIMTSLGIQGAKTLDPRAAIDIAMILAQTYTGARNTQVPKSLSNFFGKFFGEEDAVLASRMALRNAIGEDSVNEVASGMRILNAFGEEFKGEDLVRIMRENGIIKGADVTGETFKQSLKEALEFNPDNKWTVTKELGKFWRYPSMVEDYGRGVAFMGFIRQGYSVKQATNKTNEVLFDYFRGLTNFEKNVVRRIVPFYSYQRFAIPFVLKKMMNEPGQLAAAQKVTNLMEKLLVSEQDTLTSSEREVFGDSLWVEQPRLYTGFDKDGKAKFNILNNMLPFDALSLFVYDTKTNEFDLSRTMQKTVMAALTPFLKVPLETLVVKENFFTGRATDEGTRLGDLNYISRTVPDWAKELMGWEDRVNQKTGKVSTYINGYFAYSMMNFVPALRSWIKPFSAGESALDKAMELIAGVSVKRIDLKELQEWQAIGDAKQAREIKGQIRKAKLMGANTLYEQSLQEYREFLDVIRQGNAKKREESIRGLGIAGQAELLRQEQPQGGGLFQ